MEDSEARALEKEQTVCLPDGRRLGYLIVGEGQPVFYFHGTASSRLEIQLLKAIVSTEKLRLIGVDRPGYGLSTFVQRKTLREFASDINYLAEYLGIERFALLGWSGGGPYALTYVALFPQNVTRVVIVGSPALPFEVATAHNNPLARYAMKVPSLGMWAIKRMQVQVSKARKDVATFLRSNDGKKVFGDWCEEDAKFFANETWLTLMLDAMAEAFRQNDYSVKAVFQEHQILTKPWAEPLCQIPDGKVHIWHGTDDKTCRVDNAYRNAKAVPGAQLEVFEGKGHCLMFENIGKLEAVLSS
jgi:pimeloyl-ACP methyl ester carboxylesterase